MLRHRDYVGRGCWLADRDTLTIRRVVCDNCKGVVRLLPPFVAPYKHYGRPAIDEALQQVQQGTSAEDVRVSLHNPDRQPDASTVRRWIKEFPPQKNYRRCVERSVSGRYDRPAWKEKRLRGDCRGPTESENFRERSDGSTWSSSGSSG